MLACTESDTATLGVEAILVLKIPNGSLAGAPSCSSAKMHAAIEDSSAGPSGWHLANHLIHTR